MKPLTKKILMGCAFLTIMVFACDIKKEKVSTFFTASPVDSSASVEKAKSLRPEDRAWLLCWRIPPSTKSVSGKREACSLAKIVRLDDAYFTITATYEHQWQRHQAVLNWEKAKDQEKGYWSQPAPKISGTWALKKISPDLYNGWYHDSKGGEDGVLWLVRK